MANEEKKDIQELEKENITEENNDTSASVGSDDRDEISVKDVEEYFNEGFDEIDDEEFFDEEVDIEKIKHLSNELKLDIKANLNKSFFSLSGGMKQKLLIAISLAKKSGIIIYDEPTANLDPKARDDFYRLLKQNEDDKVLLFVTHRLEEVEEIVNRQIYMDMGKIISDETI